MMQQYTFAATGASKRIRSKTFFSRQAATQHMYDVCGKLGTAIKEIYNDKHSKTYICEDGTRFFINRV